MSGGILLSSSDLTFTVTVGSMSSDTGISSYYGMSLTGWRTLNGWNPTAPGTVGSLSTPNVLVKGQSVYLPVAAMYVSIDNANQFNVVIQSTPAVPVTTSDFRSCLVQSQTGTYESGNMFQIIGAITGSDEYFLIRFNGYSSTNLWTSSTIGATKTVILRR